MALFFLAELVFPINIDNGPAEGLENSSPRSSPPPSNPTLYEYEPLRHFYPRSGFKGMKRKLLEGIFINYIGE